MMAADKFSVHMEAVAKAVLGEPNTRLSSDTELRYGQHGSLSIDLAKGVWTDHEANTGGGVIDFLMSRKGLKTGEALDWLREQIGADIEDRREVKAKPRIVATYDYTDEAGNLLFQTVRLDPKDFRQRRREGDGWVWSVRGVRQVLYRLPDVIRAVAEGRTIYIVEGEKDAEAAAREGLCATCNAMGSGKWPAELSSHLAGADVVILPDNDDAGRNHAAIVAAALKDVAERVRILELPGLPPKGDLSDWLTAGGDRAELERLADEQGEAFKPAPPQSRFGAVCWADLDRVNVNYQPLVKGLIFQGDTGMIYGESGSGKSFLAVDMGLSIARGVPFLGMKTAKGSVLYQAGEGGKGLLKRLKAYRQENRLYEDLPFVLLPDRVNLFSPDGDTEEFIAECLAWQSYLPEPLALIVIDTFSAASPGANENASEDMGRMLDAGYRLNKATDAAVVWVHHKNAAGLRERGHSSFRANIETVLEVKRDEETKERSVRLVKLKDGEDGWIKGFELQSIELGTDDDGDPITSCVVRPAQVGSSGTGKKQFLPRGQFNFLRVLDDAICQYGGVVPVGGEAPAGTYGVEYPRFRDLYKAVFGAGKEPGAIRTAISRDGDALWRAGLIERHEEWFWITEKGKWQLSQ